MKKEDFENLLHQASKEFSSKKKIPSTPGKQFEKGALWLWNLLMARHESIYYEEILRREVADREEKVPVWKESLIADTAALMADRDGMMADIIETGRIVEKKDKNLVPYKESNPLYVHKKELDRTIGIYREHLGLSNKVNPERIKASANDSTSNEKNKIAQFYEEATK